MNPPTSAIWLYQAIFDCNACVSIKKLSWSLLFLSDFQSFCCMMSFEAPFWSLGVVIVLIRLAFACACLGHSLNGFNIPFSVFFFSYLNRLNFDPIHQTKKEAQSWWFVLDDAGRSTNTTAWCDFLFPPEKLKDSNDVIANLSVILPELVSFHKNRGWILTINTNRRDENEQQGFEHAKCWEKKN